MRIKAVLEWAPGVCRRHPCIDHVSAAATCLCRRVDFECQLLYTLGQGILGKGI